MIGDAEVKALQDDVLLTDGVLAALSLVSDSVIILDLDHRVRWFNRAARVLTCVDEDDLGSLWVDHLPDGADYEIAELAMVQGGAQPRAFPSMRIDAYGMTVAVEVTIARVEQDGRLHGLVVLARDNAEQELLQEAVAEMARRSEETQTLAKVGLWVWDQGSNNMQWTAELYRMHGVKPMDFEGTLEAHLALIDGEDQGHAREAFHGALRSGDETQVTYPIVTADGEIWIHARARVAKDDTTGEVTGLVGTCQDITQQQRYADAIETANRELERFAGAAAHDLRMPLTVMVGMADLLVYMVSEDETAKLLASKIVDAGNEASEMIGDLIASAREAAVRRSMAPVALSRVVTRVRTSLQTQLEGAGASLLIDAPVTLDGSEALLRQLFFNLIVNAIKYRDRDRPLVIDVTATSDAARLVVRVVDNGLGIPLEDRPEVFTEGARVHLGRDIEGDGMGLSTCREIVAQHGGTIAVEDGVDGGTAMVMTFPRTGAAPQD